MSLLLTHSVRVLPHSIRQLLSEQAKVQSMYASSHWSTHFAPVSSSLKTNRPKPDYIGSMTNKKTHGQVFGRTKSKKFAQLDAIRKIGILFLIIMMK